MAAAPGALDATLHLASDTGERTLPLAGFKRPPRRLKTVLESGEVITAIEVSTLSLDRHPIDRKVHDRASYAFALV